MKLTSILSLCGIFLALSASATEITFSDTDPDESKATAALETITILRNSGLSFKALSEGVFQISAKNILCETSHNGALGGENPDASVARNSCRINSSHKQHSKKGKRLAESSPLLEILNRFELSDCAMGYCGTFLTSLDCTVDTKVDSFNGQGRFSCTLVTKE